jgi:hypothetical protein
LIHQPEKPSDELDGYRGISIYGTEKLTLSDITLIPTDGLPCLEAIELDACEKVEINTVKADGNGGTAIKIRDRRESEDTVSRYAKISNCMLDGFSAGIEYENNNDGGDIYQWKNLFIDVQNPIVGENIHSD